MINRRKQLICMQEKQADDSMRDQERTGAGAGIGTALLALMIILSAATPGAAKQGAYIGVETVFNDIEGNVNPGKAVASGSGLGMKGGFGFNGHIALESSFWTTNHDVEGSHAVELRGFMIDVKVTFPVRDSPIEPYLLVGVGSYRLDTTRGDGWHYGAGMDIYLFPSVSFNAGLSRRIIDFGTTARVSGAVTGMDFGFAYHFP
jgi:hypothetical protein